MILSEYCATNHYDELIVVLYKEEQNELHC